MSAQIVILRHWILETLWNVSLSATVILSLALVCSFALGRVRAATRHFLWFSAVFSIVCLWGISTVPEWPTRGIPAPGEWLNQISMSINQTVSPPATATAFSPPASISPALVQSQPLAGAQSGGFKRGLDITLVCVWIIGLIILSLRTFYCHIQLWKLRQSARQPGGREVELLKEVAREMGVRRPVTLLISPDPIMPMTWGWWRQVVLLPAEGREWTRARLRLVLAHELAHVRRQDTLTQSVMTLASRPLWFHPLVWVAARRMRIEREQACDDLVLAAGAPASDYAEHLLDIALNTRSVVGTAALRMAMPGQLESRLRAIVAAGKKRGRLRRGVALSMITISAGVILLLSGRGVAQPASATRHVSKRAPLLVDFPPSPFDEKALAGRVPEPNRVLKTILETDIKAVTTNQAEIILVNEINGLKSKLVELEAAAYAKDPSLRIYGQYVEVAHDWVAHKHSREFNAQNAYFAKLMLRDKSLYDLTDLIDTVLARDLAGNTNFAPLLKFLFDAITSKATKAVAMYTSSYSRCDSLIGFHRTAPLVRPQNFEAYVAELDKRYDLVRAKIDEIQREKAIPDDVLLGILYGDLYRLLDSHAQTYVELQTPPELTEVRQQLRRKYNELSWPQP